MNIWCKFEKKISWKLRGVGHIQEKLSWPPSGQKWNCRAPKIDWDVGLGLRNVWCVFEKDQLKTLIYSAHKKQIWYQGCHKWNRRAPIIDWHLNLGSTHIWSEYEEIDWKLWYLVCIQENFIWSSSGHKWNCRASKIDWHRDLGTRGIWPEFEKDWTRIVGCRAHRRNFSSGSDVMVTNA